jgi:carboxymethylenebutenolidase
VLVAENDAAITVEQTQLRRLDGMVNAYAAYPKIIHGNTPGIVVAMHLWSIDEQIRHTVRRFAKAGFTCIAPDLYSRSRAPHGDGASDPTIFQPYAAALQRKQYSGDLRAAALHLLSKAPNCKMGIVGFGIGGHIALVEAIDNGDLFDAVAPFYGALTDIDPGEIHVPICGSYGEKDASILPEDVRVWRGLLRVANEIRVYPSAGHAFFDDTRTSYVASAAADAWKRTHTFFKEVLGLQT